MSEKLCFLRVTKACLETSWRLPDVFHRLGARISPTAWSYSCTLWVLLVARTCIYTCRETWVTVFSELRKVVVFLSPFLPFLLPGIWILCEFSLLKSCLGFFLYDNLLEAKWRKQWRREQTTCFCLKACLLRISLGLQHFGCMNPKWSDLKLNYTWQESVLVSAWILRAGVSRTKICGIF